MIIRELIAQLQTYDPDMPVFIPYQFFTRPLVEPMFRVEPERGILIVHGVARDVDWNA